MGKLQVNILGTSFSADVPEDEEYLQKLLNFYKEVTESVQNSTGVFDPMKVSILAGITLVDELYKEKQKKFLSAQQQETEDSLQAEEITQKLIDQIDEVL